MSSRGLAALGALRQRPTWVWLHRWIGLVMAVFLIIAAVTGSLITFYQELDALLVPQYHELRTQPAPGAKMLDAITLRDIAVTARPDMRFDSAWAPWAESKPFYLYMYSPDGQDGELLLDPYTGEILGTRMNLGLAGGAAGVMPFIYELHYALALGTIGTWAFGVVALLWTLDCFLGMYLTFPRHRPFWSRWKHAWGIKGARFNYDLHRSSGLWTWAMLFVFAWSSVAFNLPQVYYPVTRATLGMYEAPEEEHEHGSDDDAPGMSWREAHARGRALMDNALVGRRIGPHREDALHYVRGHDEFEYYIATSFRADGEARDWFGVSFDATTGRQTNVLDEHLPNEKAGDFVTRWLIDLHMAKVWGLPFRVFVCVMGLVITALSVTGIVIWWRKRRRGVRHKVSEVSYAP